MKKYVKREAAITLIALVVTIILLLILAGVSIYFVANNGLIDKTMEAADKQDKETVKEAVMLKKGEAYIDQYQRGITTSQYFIEKGYMDAVGVINVEKTVGRKLKSGEGTDNKDVYKIEEGDLVYYSPEGVKEVLAENVMEGEASNTPKVEYEFDAATGTITGIKNKADYYEDGWNNGSDGNCILPETEIVIPSQINGVEVKAIKCKYGDGSGVFRSCKNITKVVIPATVTQVGGTPGGIVGTGEADRGEFYGCDNLKEVVIESSAITLYSAYYPIFGNCNNLEKITFTNMERKDAPAGTPWGAPSTCTIAYKGDKIEYDFDVSTKTITGIKNKADYYDGGWSGIGYEDGVGNCILPESEIYIPSQINGVAVERFGNGGVPWIFNKCTNVKKVVIPDTVAYIGNHAMYRAGNIEVVIESHAPLTIDPYAFADFTGKITFTNITTENAPEGAPWGASSSCTIQYK